jgi:DNA polymerase III subunit delta'
MIIGREYEKNIFVRLKERGGFAGSFLFFGESQVGKFTFADELTRELEGNKSVLSERMVLSGKDSKIGIDDIRKMKIFLRSKPLSSEYRSVIIDGAEMMTPEAQNAALKMVEEPPGKGLIIFIASHPDSLLPTLAGRLRRVHFPRVPFDIIESWLINEKGVSDKEAKHIASMSFGRPGFALDLLEHKNDFFIKTDIPKKFESDEEFRLFVKKSLVRLYNERSDGNIIPLKELLKRMDLSSRFNTNKRLQIQSVPWTR